MKFILGKKQNMTQVFNENGKVIPATIVNAGPISAVQMKPKIKMDTKLLFSVLGKRKKKMSTKPNAISEIFLILKNIDLKRGMLARN